MLQVARQRINEKTSRVAERGKQARADSTRELAEWGGMRRKRMATAGRGLTRPYWRLWDRGVQYSQPRWYHGVTSAWRDASAPIRG